MAEAEKDRRTVLRHLHPAVLIGLVPRHLERLLLQVIRAPVAYVDLRRDERQRGKGGSGALANADTVATRRLSLSARQGVAGGPVPSCRRSASIDRPAARRSSIAPPRRAASRSHPWQPRVRRPTYLFGGNACVCARCGGEQGGARQRCCWYRRQHRTVHCTRGVQLALRLQAQCPGWSIVEDLVGAIDSTRGIPISHAGAHVTAHSRQ